jgi:hypothetical protein
MWVKLSGGFALGLLALVLVSCGGGAANCPLPLPGTQQGTLEVHHNHAFGRMYEVFEVKYFLDDCLLFQTNDTSLLRRPELSSPVRAVAAGRHRFRFVFKLRADFESSMGGWEWYARGGGELEIPEGGARRLVVWLREEGDGDPRRRLKVNANVE